MLTIRQIAQIASRYETAMADAMLRACALKSLADGGAFAPSRRGSADAIAYSDDEDLAYWESLMSSNRCIKAAFRGRSSA